MFIVLLAGTGIYAQQTNMIGVWKGRLSEDDKQWGFDYSIELKQVNNIIYGTSKICSVTDDKAYVIHNIEGKVNGDEVTFFDLSINQESGNINFSWCKKTYSGKLITYKDSLVVSGVWKNDGRKTFQNRQIVDNSPSYCSPGVFKIKMGKVVKDTVPKNEELFLEAPIAGIASTSWNVQSREVKIKESIKVNADSVKLMFFDNGEVDNDTISVYYNKQLIVSNKRLSNKAIEVVVAIEPNKDNELVMFAENEGTSPPNTALMVFYDKGARREVTIDSSTKKSEAIILKKQPMQ